jgi:hypothetical protein
MDTTTPLTADQRLLLATAMQRRDRLVVLRPDGLRARGAVRQRLLAALLECGLVEERPTKDEALAWRRDERGRHCALRLTAAGLTEAAALGASPDTKSGTVGAGRHASPRRSPRKAAVAVKAEGGEAAAVETAIAPALSRQAPGGKLGQVLKAVGAVDGATLAELVGLTGWQPHTTRAALTRLRQRGHGLHLDTSGERRAYRLDPARQG